jgi:ABC-2 family transporter protein
MLTRIWLTIKQHRFETIAIAVVCLGLTAAALIESYRLNSLNLTVSCLQTYQGPYMASQGPVTAAQQHCNELAQSFLDMKNGTDMSLVGFLLAFAPLLVGIVFGAPLVAREIEQGTAPLSWALSGSRRRWLLGKVLTGVLLLVPLMLAVGLVANAFEGAQQPGLDPYASFDNYLNRGVIDVFWALAAFAGTFALGTLLGRTMPAVILALVVCFFVRVTWDGAMSHVVLKPYAIQQPTVDVSDSGGTYIGSPYFYSGMTDMYVYQKVFLDGKEITQDQANTWFEQNMMCAPVEMPTPGDGASPGVSSSPGDTSSPGALATPDDSKPGLAQAVMTCTGAALDPSQTPQYVEYIIPGAWYWNVVALESGLLLLGSLLLGAVAFVWVDRRRPY